jgi:REP element-mobilizing transposase RayT
MVIEGEQAVYHVISRTALDGFPFGDAENEYLVSLINRLRKVYYTEMLGFCCMGNHFHLLTRMLPEVDFADKEIQKRYEIRYGKDRDFAEGQIPFFRTKLSSLSEFVKEIKIGFSRYYNRRHNRRGFLWGGRFKSVIVENGQALINCLAYIDLNPVRAGIVENPEDYRWNSIGHHVQTNNKDSFLSLDFGLKEFNVLDADERLRFYRKFLYEKGSNTAEKGSQIAEKTVDKKRSEDFKTNQVDRFMSRTRYFSDSGVIGKKEFVAQNYQRFKHHFQSKNDKIPKLISGLDGVYSLKRLSSS